MSRVPLITSKVELPSDMGHVFEAILESRGSVSGPFSILLNSPEMAGHVARLGAYIRFESTLPSSDRELVILTTARELDCDYIWATHEPLAREAKVRLKTIEVVAQGRQLNQLEASEATIIEYGRELLRWHRISDRTFQALRERFSDQEIVELACTVGYYALLASILNTLDMGPVRDSIIPRLTHT